MSIKDHPPEYASAEEWGEELKRRADEFNACNHDWVSATDSICLERCGIM